MTWECSPESGIKKSKGKRLLSDEQVEDAKSRYSRGETLQQIGSALGVSLGVAHYAIRGRLLSDESDAVVGVPKRDRTPEMRAKMSAAGKLRPPMSDETREKIRATLKGRQFSDESIAKMSSAAKGRRYGPDVCAQRSAARKKCFAENPGLRIKCGNGNRGKTYSAEKLLKHTAAFQDPEVRARMSAAHKGKPWTEAQRAARTKQPTQ
jgi:hypothetical protein